MNSIIVSVAQLNLGTTLAFCFSDGSIDFRSRPSLDPLPHDDSPDRASSLAQVGLAFPHSSVCKYSIYQKRMKALTDVTGLHAALSPNACAAVTLDDTDVAGLRLMQIPQVYPGETLHDSKCIRRDAEHTTDVKTHSYNRCCGRDLCHAILDFMFWLWQLS